MAETVGDRLVVTRDLGVQISLGDPSFTADRWVSLAAAAPTLAEELGYLSRALALSPDHPVAGRRMQAALRRQLVIDPSLGYLSESDLLYLVHTASGQLILTNKDRAVPERYPPVVNSPSEHRRRWLALALLGLPPAGVGTLVCAPIAAFLALRGLRQPLTPVERRRAVTHLGLAVLMLILALALNVLLFLHLQAIW